MSRKKDVLIFLLGLFSLVKLRLLGTFSVAELFALLSLPFIPWKRYKSNPQVKKMILFGTLWIVGVLISDFFNGTSTENCLKGTFNVLFLCLLFPFIYWICYDSPKRLLYFWGGQAISSLLDFYVFKSYDDPFLIQVWQTYAWAPFFIFISGYYYSKDKKIWSYLILEAFSIWTLYYHSRNIFLTSTIAIVFLIYVDRILLTDFKDTLRNYKKRILLATVVLFMGVGFADIAYEYGAERGYLGEYAYNKYMAQKYTQYGLVSGRIDALMSLELIKDNPIVGYGSYAKDTYGFRDNFLYDHGYALMKNEKENLLPGHSYILGAWVYSGILSLPFWLFVLYQIYICIRRGNILKDSRLLGLNVILAMSFLWKILFSPFSDRILFVAFIMMIVLLNSPSSRYNFSYSYSTKK